ncbi:hypothetical protein TRFO_22933 [Tritrichomonas foetus]|uniref:Uncharacterized protein n=1 Tax=Tritrichomonas foetus TaxID=1144522 RepID=A0A1J4KC21_9EUKA|nr:hypothetical protein TRFO_22933 [Tritrichomonas foetus]|eukprot:OHT08514.1 hypothetical protein TRFO_22933 [Tritrichomonas foetus]
MKNLESLMHSITFLTIPLPLLFFIYSQFIFKHDHFFIIPNNLSVFLATKSNKAQMFMLQNDFSIVGLGCDIAKKHKFTSLWKIDDETYIKAYVAQCNPNNTRFGAREFDTIFLYLRDHYDELRNKTIFTHAHDESPHYPGPPLGQISKLIKTKYFHEEQYGEFYPFYIRRPLIKTENETKITLYQVDFVPLILEIMEGTKVMKKAFNDTLNDCVKQGIKDTIVTRSSSFFISREFVHYFPKSDYFTLIENIHNHIRARNSTSYNHLFGEYLERAIQIMLARRCVRVVPPPELGKERIVNCC